MYDAFLITEKNFKNTGELKRLNFVTQRTWLRLKSFFQVIMLYLLNKNLLKILTKTFWSTCLSIFSNLHLFTNYIKIVLLDPLIYDLFYLYNQQFLFNYCKLNLNIEKLLVFTFFLLNVKVYISIQQILRIS